MPLFLTVNHLGRENVEQAPKKVTFYCVNNFLATWKLLQILHENLCVILVIAVGLKLPIFSSSQSPTQKPLAAEEPNSCVSDPGTWLKTRPGLQFSSQPKQPYSRTDRSSMSGACVLTHQWTKLPGSQLASHDSEFQAY